MGHAPDKISPSAMRETGVHDVLIYCGDHKCSHHSEVSAGRDYLVRTNTSMSSIRSMGAKTPTPHSRAFFTVSLFDCRFGVMRANLSFRNAHRV
jgi:hypothetical protein